MTYVKSLSATLAAVAGLLLFGVLWTSSVMFPFVAILWVLGAL